MERIDIEEWRDEIDVDSAIDNMIEDKHQEELKQKILVQNKMNVLKSQGVGIEKPFAERLIEDIKKSNKINLDDIYTYSTDYYALINYLSSLPKYKRIFKSMPSRKDEFKDVVLTVLSRLTPNNASHIFTDIISALKVYI
jgi:hypothetical protein